MPRSRDSYGAAAVGGDAQALVVIHPHEEFDYGVNEENIVRAAENFDGDVFYVPDTRDGDLDSLYGDNVYDYLLTGETKGELEDDTVEEIAEGYDEVFLGGGYAKQCLRNAHRSFVESEAETNVYIVPALSFAQQFNVTDGEEDTIRYNLEDVMGDENKVQKHFGHFFGDSVGIATAL
ncbi:MAG: hypothetical protein ABEI97_00015 [Candidatus Nanohaloarchaea archaeon]